MEIEWLRTFLAVIDTGSFSQAVDRVHRSQSRVSAHIAALERDLGVTLIDRSRRPAVPTRAGRLLEVRARDIVAGLAATRSELRVLADPERATITLVTTPGIAAAFVPDVLREFAVQCPGVAVHVVERAEPGEPGEWVRDGAALAVLPTGRSQSPAGVRCEPLWRDRTVLVVHPDHPLAARFGDHPVPVRALEGNSLMLLGGLGESMPRQLLQEHGLCPSVSTAVGTAQTLLGLVRADFGEGTAVGVVNSLALTGCETVGSRVLELAGPGLDPVVAAWWDDPLLGTEAGRMLHKTVLGAPAPPGTVELAEQDLRTAGVDS